MDSIESEGGEYKQKYFGCARTFAFIVPCLPFSEIS